MSRPHSRKGVRRAHSAPHSHRARSNLSLVPISPTPIYTGNGNILYIDGTPSPPTMRGTPDDHEIIAPTPDLLNGRPIIRRMRHYSDQPHRIYNKRPITIPVGMSKPPLITPMTAADSKISSSSVQKRPSGRSVHVNRHHQSTGNLSQIIQKPGGSSLYQQPQAISRWYEFDDSCSSQTSLASDHTLTHLGLPPQTPSLAVQPPSSHDLSLAEHEPPQGAEKESSKAYLDSYPPSPYEFDSPVQGPFSAAFEEMESQLSPSSSFYGGASSVSGYVPSPLAIEGKMAVRSNVLHVPISPISPYAVSRPKSPAPSVISQVSTSTVTATQNRPPLRQSTPLGTGGRGRGGASQQEHQHHQQYDQGDPTSVNLMPKLQEESKTGSQVLLAPSLSPKPVKSPGHNSHSLDCLDSSTTAMPVVSGGHMHGDHPLIGKEGHSNSSPSLRVNGINPAIFRFPIPPPPASLVSAGDRGGRHHLPPSSSSHGFRRADHHFQTRVLSKFPRSTSQTSVQSLSLRSDVSASAGSVISTRSDMWGGRRFGGGHGNNNTRFSRQYYSYRRPHVPNPRGQRAYKSFRQEFLMRSM